MKGELISCAHKDIYFLETNTNCESTNLANLIASRGARDQIKYKPSTKLKQKFNPTLDFFIQNNTKKTGAQEHKALEENNRGSNKCASRKGSKNDSSRTRRSSIDLYEEAAAILGLTCSQTDSCRCIECQCHYFDFEEEIDFQTGNEYVVEHASLCTIQ